MAPLALLAGSHAFAQSAPGERELTWEDLMPVPAKLDSEAQAAVAGINAFSLELYRETVPPEKDHFISPASVSVAMSLAYRAAGGTTAAELRRVMHYTAAPQDYLRSTASVLQSMNFKKAGRELATANSIWIDNSVTLRPDYLADTTGLAGSAVEQADFQGAPENARLAINQWVEDRTNHKIKELLQPPNVNPSVRSVLVNTIYWKANWADDFSKEATKKGPFRQLDGSRAELELMNQQSSYQVLEHDGIKAILMPYQGGELEMAVFLPNSSKGLPKFEASLTPELIDGWFARLEATPARPTILTLPKMRLDWREDLVPALQGMGLEAPFGLDADFSAIAIPEDGGVLAIGAIIHQTYLEVDEKGSEAAAATAVVGVVVTGSRKQPDPPPPFIFRADKPFFFVLRDRRTGLICFMGRFVGGEATE